ncbi:uncharacterized protein LOC121377018 [Gigantopelta aegis]|uniref:uncharacterized protein LOC121377018 n=1 Tax=Gigantopelta aegis TaxID=1735272 RepID=UPI001B88A625|nr:uncharacterized protein LOC121377018 [Gigantopelta aegis]
MATQKGPNLSIGMSVFDSCNLRLEKGDIVKINHGDKDFIYAIYIGNGELVLQTPEGSYTDAIENATWGRSFYKHNHLDEKYQAQRTHIIISQAVNSKPMTSDDGGLCFAESCRYGVKKTKAKKIPKKDDSKKNSVSSKNMSTAYATTGPDGTMVVSASGTGHASVSNASGNFSLISTPKSLTISSTYPVTVMPGQSVSQATPCDVIIYDSRGNTLTPGDVIVFDCGEFQHFGIYVGNGDVVHMTVEEVKKEQIGDVADENPFFVDHTIKPSFLKDGIVNTANCRVGMKAMYQYDEFNCEGFVNEVTCARRQSKQVEEFLKQKGLKKNSLFGMANGFAGQNQVQLPPELVCAICHKAGNNKTKT